MVYLFHRIEHAVPFLWAIHSMHHADTRVTVVTAYVNYWAAALLETGFVYPVVLVVFKVPAMFILAGAWTRYFSSLFVHAETKLHLGPIGYLVVGPQYHRIHHSSEPQFYGKNFTGMFPLWDWLFGTLVIPGRDQFPQTGLELSEAPADSVLTLWWPWRKHLGQEFR